MTWNVNISTDGLEQVDPPALRGLPPLSLDQPLKSQFFVSQFPTTATVSPDAVNNFRNPGIPSYRISPPPPLTLAGSGTNATPTVAVSSFNILAPPSPTISSPLATTPTGYSFSFLQVRLPLGSQTTISTYKVYRASTSSNTSATVIQSIPHHPNSLGVPVVIQDSQPNGTTQFYWVSAVSTAGLESSMTPAQSSTVTNKAALNSNSQLASSFNGVAINTTFGCVNATTLSNTGSSPNTAIAANSNLFGPGFLSYNSGSVAPASFVKIYVFANDLTFQGGAVPYSFAFLNFSISGDGSIPLGAIAIASGVATTGGGNSGGTTPNGAGGRGLLP
jgi:hypothetical protein